VTTLPVKKCTSMQACYMYVDDRTVCCTLNEKCIKLIIVTSSNRTPGSSFYSDLLDTSVCIHQLVLKHCSSARLLA